MANLEQLALLKKCMRAGDFSAWDEWRWNNRVIHEGGSYNLAPIDLSNTHLRRANLSNIDLNGADLQGTDLRSAELSDASLDFADLRGANLAGASLWRIQLTQAKLENANLRGAVLRNGDLSHAHLKQADLRSTVMYHANLSHADLEGANLRGAVVGHADFSYVNLRSADLSNAFLGGTIFMHTKFEQAKLHNARLRYGTFSDVDLSNVNGLESIRHEGPSTIGIDTVYKSSAHIPEVFLRGCGLPEIFIAYAHSLVDKPVQFYTCFISHSARDIHFCERLHADLQAKGVRTWYFPEDAKWGETVWGEIDRSIKIYDKLVVVLSENSLRSGPVLREIERALNREDKEGKNILFPVRIDDYIFKHWKHERKADVLAKVVGDFSSWERGVTKYEQAFHKLLNGLQAENSKNSIVGTMIDE